MASDTPIDCERVSLDFLEAPSHPELLGRIGRYEIERVLGTGGMGVVLRAFDTDLHRVVAIKVLASHLANNSSARRRFAREAQAAAAVVHPNVVPIYNVESDAKTPYIVMHYVAGKSLQRRVDVGGPLPIVEALRIAQQTAAGLSAAHAQGLVHRDVKPANILLEEQIDRVLLSDFGLRAPSMMLRLPRRASWLVHRITCHPSKRWEKRSTIAVMYSAWVVCSISCSQVIHRFERPVRWPYCIAFASSRIDRWWKSIAMCRSKCRGWSIAC